MRLLNSKPTGALTLLLTPVLAIPFLAPSAPALSPRGTPSYTFKTPVLPAAALRSGKFHSEAESQGQHHNTGLDPTALPFELEYADPERTVLKAFGENYTFTDLFSLSSFTSVADDASIPDLLYYEFTEANLEASQHALFYAYWSITAQDTADFAELGEWGAFAARFMNTRNSRCNWDSGSCKGIVSLEELRRMYPGEGMRPLVRLIYFTGIKMELMHDVHRGVESHMTRVQQTLVGRIPTIIRTFTSQPDANKKFWCDVAHKAVKASIDLGIQCGLMALETFVPIPGLDMIVGNSQLNQESLRRFFGVKSNGPFAGVKWPAGGFNGWLKDLSPAAKLATGITGKPMAISINLNSKLAEKIPGWIDSSIDKAMKKAHEDIGLDQGYETGTLCGAWEGDATDRSEQNIEKLRMHLPEYFEKSQRGIRDLYRELIEGKVLVPGQPTLLSLYGLNLKWAGPGSLQSTLRDMEPMKRAISTALEKSIISSTSRSDGNWQICTHDANAPALCATARLNRETAKPSPKVSDAMTSLVCPLPSTDPTLICQGGRWYWNRRLSHVHGFASLKTIFSYRSANLNYTYESAVREAYLLYLRYGNTMDDDTRSWGLGRVTGSGLRMPVCQSEYLKVKDYSEAAPHERPWKQWQFPGVCGEAGRETEEFLKAINTGVGSQNWNAGEGRGLMLYYDRLPRLYNEVSPFTSYVSYAAAGIQFPLRDPEPGFWGKVWNALRPSQPDLHEFWQVKKGIDADYALVRNATAQMSEFEGNVWFCVDGVGQHTVFKRERSHADISDAPAKRVESHETRCRQWVKRHRKEIADFKLKQEEIVGV